MKLDHKEKGPLTLPSQTDHMKILFIESISQEPADILAFGLDSFKGTVSEFRSLLEENKLRAENGLTPLTTKEWETRMKKAGLLISK